MSATKEQLELFLFYLSETHTKSLSLHDLVTSRPRPEEARILLNINEVHGSSHHVLLVPHLTQSLGKYPLLS